MTVFFILFTSSFFLFPSLSSRSSVKKEFIKKGHKVDIFALSASKKPEKAGQYILGMPKNPFLERLYRLLMFLDIKIVNIYANILINYDFVISHLYPMNILACKAIKKNKSYSQYLDKLAFSLGICFYSLRQTNNIPQNRYEESLVALKMFKDALIRLAQPSTIADLWNTA